MQDRTFQKDHLTGGRRSGVSFNVSLKCNVPLAFNSLVKLWGHVDYVSYPILSGTEVVVVVGFFYTFHLKTYNTYYLIPLLTKYYTLLQKQYHLERKTTSTNWQHKTENTNIALHVATHHH